MAKGVSIYSDIESVMEADLEGFVSNMVAKLEKNKHKDALEPPDLPALMRLAMTEMGEVVEQLLRDKRDANMLMELADAANFLFLVARRIEGDIRDAG